MHAVLWYDTIRMQAMRVAPPSLELSPRFDEFGLPHYSPDNLRAIAAAGYRRVGVVAAVILQDTQRSNLLMLHHVPSEKVAPTGAWGPLAETSHIAEGNEDYEVESAAATIYRSFEEETGMQARFLRPSVPSASVGAYTTCKWPIGHGHEGSFAYGVVPFLYLTNQEAAQKLVTSFSPTEEIDQVKFMQPDEIRSQRYLRPGVLEWLSVVENSASYGLGGPFLELPTPQRLSGDGQDVIFANLTL